MSIEQAKKLLSLCMTILGAILDTIGDVENANYYSRAVSDLHGELSAELERQAAEAHEENLARDFIDYPDT